MGGFMSSQRRFRVLSSLRGNRHSHLDRRRGVRSTHPCPKQKRSSMNRPVLRLQLKADTIDKRQKRNGTTTVAVVPRSTLRSIVRDSGVYADYDHLPPVVSTENTDPHPPSDDCTISFPLHQRSHSVDSHDSMVIVQFVDNGAYAIHAEDKDENDYDKLLPPGEFDHLCTCTYGRVNSTTDAPSKESHLSTIQISKNGSQPTLIENLNASDMKERILLHLQPSYNDHSNGWRRSRSFDASYTHRINERSPSYHTRRNVQSTSYMDDTEWSLGESVIRTLSRSGTNIFNIDNPTHESEIEVTKAWPHLKEKMQKLRDSEAFESSLEESGDHDGVFPPLV